MKKILAVLSTIFLAACGGGGGGAEAPAPVVPPAPAPRADVVACRPTGGPLPFVPAPRHNQ